MWQNWEGQGFEFNKKYLFLQILLLFWFSSVHSRDYILFQSGTFSRLFIGLQEFNHFIMHTEVKYSIAGVEFQAAKQFILSSFGIQLYLSVME